MWCYTSFHWFRSLELNGQPFMCSSNFLNTTSKWLVSYEPNDLDFKLSNIYDSILAQGNACSTNFGTKVAFLANICNCKLIIFSPPHNRGVHISSSHRSRTPLLMRREQKIACNFWVNLLYHVFCVGIKGQLHPTLMSLVWTHSPVRAWAYKPNWEL